MSTIKYFVKRHPLLTYFTVVFTISWGSILLGYGPGVFLGTREVSFVGASPFAYLGFLAGPSVAGIMMTGLVNGKAGLRDFRFRLFNWHVSARWYAVALLTAPLLMTATLAALSLSSPVSLPAIITADDKIGLLVPAIIIGLGVSFFEELGWAGFAIPQLGRRYGILATGLIVGLPWGVWHFPLFSASVHSSGVIAPVLYEAILLFSWLPPYRVLMVWVYNHTKSLFVLMVMHFPIVVSQFVLRPEKISGVALSTQLILFGGTLWAVAAVVLKSQVQRRLVEENSPVKG
jgi:membrane protease YdiL (CAAX protease family)